MKSYILILIIASFYAFCNHTLLAREEAKYDILLRGGHVINPANNINSVMDVAVQDGKIASIEKSIPDEKAKRVFDVSNYYVTPGFIDIHAHVFYTFFTPSARSIIADDFCFPSGVTTVVDAGTSGAESFEDFKMLIDKSQTRILAFINIAAPGMNSAEQDPAQFDVTLAVSTAKKYPDIIVGFKTAHYWASRPYDSLHTPWASVDSLMKAGRAAGLPVMIDFFPRPAVGKYPERSYRELILEKMRPGDIHTHVFAIHIPVINDDGTLNQDLVKAQKRGVIFDIGHGAGSIVFRNAVPAMKQGFIPSSISTDLHGGNTNGPVINMINVMSKFLNMGLSLEEVVRLSTLNPAKEINRPELGNLSVGSPADIAVCDLLHGNFSYTDTRRGKIKGNQKLQCVLTISGGRIVFDPSGFSYTEWEKIPKNSDYWKISADIKH